MTITDVPPLALDLLAADAPIGAGAGCLSSVPHLSAFFGDRPVVGLRAAEARGLVGWGQRRSGRAARARAEERGLAFAALEDGFLRSVGLGKAGAATVSLLVDDIGVHYAADRPSRLERLLCAAAQFDPALLERARRGCDLWVGERLSKYNLGRETPPPGAPRVLLVDQVRGDESIAGAGASEAAFIRMLEEALATFGRDRIAVRAHPDVTAGRARGYLAGLPQAGGLPMLDPDLSSAAALDGAEAVWTVSSQLGFEALLRNLPVTTYGMPFYAGWGLTEDRATGPVAEAARGRRQGTPGRDALFAGCFLQYARYADPVRKVPLTFEEAVARILDWRARVRNNAAGPTYCFGFSAWKRPAAERFLGTPGNPVHLVSKATARSARRRPIDGARVAVWGMTDSPGFVDVVQPRATAVLRVEDGFLRSVGLGSDLRTPGSLVIDDLGIYYDASRPSRLEAILSQEPAPEEVTRAQALIERLRREGLTKYNLGSAPLGWRTAAGDRRVVLVVEQVPRDAALRFGSGAFSDNLSLLRAVRAERPEAFIVYKEHPDLVSGNRRGRLSRQVLAQLADVVLSEGDMASLFAVLDEMHVISSLAGFEALLRGVEVHVWGRPFYAGWGLTHDRCTFPRRTMRHSCASLAAGALISYPSYADPVTGTPCGVEDFLDALVDARRRGAPAPEGLVRRQAGRLIRWAAGKLAL